MVRHPGLLLLLLLLTSSPPPSRPSPPPPPAGGRGELVMQKRLPGATAAAAAGAEEDEEDGGGGTTAGGGTEGGGTLEKYSGVKVRISFTRGGETMSLKQLSGGQRTLGALPLAGLLHTLAEGFVKQDHHHHGGGASSSSAAVDYGCRVSSLALMQELLLAIRVGQLMTSEGQQQARVSSSVALLL